MSLWSTTAETKNGLRESNKPPHQPQVSGFKKLKKNKTMANCFWFFLWESSYLSTKMFRLHQKSYGVPRKKHKVVNSLAPKIWGDADWILFVSLGFNLLVINTFQLVRHQPQLHSVWMCPLGEPAANLWAAERSGPLRSFSTFMSLLHMFLEITLRRVWFCFAF